MDSDDQSTAQGVSGFAYLFRTNSKVRPVLLLGAGASFRSGILFADDAIRTIAQSAFGLDKFGLNLSDSHPMLSDWLPYLKSQPWFIQALAALPKTFLWRSNIF